MDFPGLRAVADRAALYSGLRQLLMGEYLEAELGEYRWNMDTEQGTLTFSPTGGGQPIVTRAHLVASIAPGPRSMLWGWAHPQAGPDSPVGRIRELGEQHGIRELTEPELPFATDAVEEALLDEIAALAHVVGAVAVEATRMSPYYSVPAGGGTRFVFLLEGIEVPEPQILQVVSRTVHVLGASGVLDQRSAVMGLAQHTGWRIAWTTDGSTVRLTDPSSGEATFGFDEHGRVGEITGDLKAAGQH
ncbi:DUF6882 domain-containing protein [Flindersiella endophytica]